MARMNHDADHREADNDPKLRLEIIHKSPCGCCANDTHGASLYSWSPSSPPPSRSIHTLWIPSVKSFLIFIAALILGAASFSRWNYSYIAWNTNSESLTSPMEEHCNSSRESQLQHHHHHPNLTCPNSGCKERPRAPSVQVSEAGPQPVCPEYFRWIHEDLRPWRETGITREMVEGGRRFAHFRLVVVDGKAYVKHYARSFQTRDVFTLWGVLQLLRLHGGRLPDLDLMFDCNDTPRVAAAAYRPLKKKASMPPPVFRYCGDANTVQIVFPDWSFWGWPEVNIKPWEMELKELKQGRRPCRGSTSARDEPRMDGRVEDEGCGGEDPDAGGAGSRCTPPATSAPNADAGGGGGGGAGGFRRRD